MMSDHILAGNSVLIIARMYDLTPLFIILHHIQPQLGGMSLDVGKPAGNIILLIIL